MKTYIGIIEYKNPNSSTVFKDITGVCSSEDLAKESFNEFIEGFLEIERPDYEIISQNVATYEIDKGLFDNESDNSGIPF